MELHGFGGAVAVRYAAWPAGAAVRVESTSLPAHRIDLRLLVACFGDGDIVENTHLYDFVISV